MRVARPTSVSRARELLDFAEGKTEAFQQRIALLLKQESGVPFTRHEVLIDSIMGAVAVAFQVFAPLYGANGAPLMIETDLVALVARVLHAAAAHEFGPTSSQMSPARSSLDRTKMCEELRRTWGKMQSELRERQAGRVVVNRAVWV